MGSVVPVVYRRYMRGQHRPKLGNNGIDARSANNVVYRGYMSCWHRVQICHYFI